MAVDSSGGPQRLSAESMPNKHLQLVSQC
uniref:Uncharacterized protein n=1 Tax=Rhizophora mucronata TaxID=61149 RepID=A0A2P2PHR0_RHIMU